MATNLVFDDDRVLLQGFYWESSRHGYDRFPQFGPEHWYAIIAREAATIRAGRFDLIWMPPPAAASGYSAGYDPREYFRFDNSYGTFEEHRAALAALLDNGVEPIADVVINHRAGNQHWADFINPAWSTWAIVRDDEAFNNPASKVYGTPIAERGAPEEDLPYRPQGDYQYTAFRDIDHTSRDVRRDLLRYMLSLKSLGYRGWRYDMVHGYGAEWIAQYNRVTGATFSVGEYDWDQQAQQRGWVWYTAMQAGDMATSSAVFDFASFFTLKDNKGRYDPWYGLGLGVGLVGDNTDNRQWRARAVTFIENHDTAYRTNEDGTRKDNCRDSFSGGWEVEQAYAQILTHPGVPTVFWKHYFDWSEDLQNKIKALINARKVAGISSASVLALQNNARRRGVYAARVFGRNGSLYVRIGGDDGDWQPFYSGYDGYREYASGTGWRVWVDTDDPAHVIQAPLNDPIAIPVFQAALDVVVPEDAL